MAEPQTPYHLLGGEGVLRKLVKRFYEIMDSDPRAQAVRALHGPNLASAEEKLFMFLSGWLGGPSLYIERFGHPRLRARHLPFAIDEDARDQWMLCMRQALDETPMEPPLRQHIEEALYKTADFMRNR